MAQFKNKLGGKSICPDCFYYGATTAPRAGGGQGTNCWFGMARKFHDVVDFGMYECEHFATPEECSYEAVQKRNKEISDLLKANPGMSYNYTQKKLVKAT